MKFDTQKPKLTRPHVDYLLKKNKKQKKPSKTSMYSFPNLDITYLWGSIPLFKFLEE